VHEQASGIGRIEIADGRAREEAELAMGKNARR